MPGPQQQLRSPVPEGHHHRVQVSQRLQGRIEQSSKAHVCYLDPAPLRTLPHHQDVGRLQVSVENPVGVQVVDTVQDLIEQTLHHPLVDQQRFLVRLGCSVVLDDVPQVVLRVVEQQPHLSVSVGEKYLQTDRDTL